MFAQYAPCPAKTKNGSVAQCASIAFEELKQAAITGFGHHFW